MLTATGLPQGKNIGDNEKLAKLVAKKILEEVSILTSYRLWSVSALRFETILSPKDCLASPARSGHLNIT